MFIQIIQGKCTDQQRLRGRLDEWLEQLAPDAPGWLGGTYGFTDDDDFVAVIRFESREAAALNAQRPEQDAWWQGTESCFDGPVEFHDSDDVTLMLDGGSDDARFVQIMRGRVDDPERLKTMMGDTDLLHEMRPEIIGSTLAIEPDGTWTETIAFTDEESARRGEQQPMPEEMAQEFHQLMQGVTFLDLHQPWFASRG